MLSVYYWLIMAAGLGLRFWHYLENRSLWSEEAKYAISVLSRSGQEILYYVQIVPDQPLNALGFYLIEKVMTGLFGPGEYALRLYPLLCSVLAFFFFSHLARYYLKPKTLLVALSFFAFSDALIYFSAEVKPYSCDVLMGLILLVYFERAKRLGFGPKNMLALSVLGAAVIWFSNASLFMLAAVGICLTDQIISFKHYKRIPSFIGVISVWTVSFLALYLVAFSHLIQSHYAWSAVKGKFCESPFWSVEMRDWVIQVSQSMFENPGGFSFPLVASITFLTGVQAMARKDMERFCLIMIPFFLVFITGCFRLYPVFGREILFLSPLIYIIVAAGLGWLPERFGKKGLAVSIMAGILLFYQPLASAIGTVRAGHERQQNRQVMDYLNVNYQKGDVICLNASAVYPFAYYANRVSANRGEKEFFAWEISDKIIASKYGRWLPLSRVLFTFNEKGVLKEAKIKSSFAMMEASMKNIFKHERVWLFFSGPRWPAEKLTMDYFNRLGERRQGVVFNDAAVFLYDMKNPNRYAAQNAAPIVFLGDSMFALNDWVSFMKNENIVNLGVVGDTIAGVYERLDGILPLNPEKIFLMAGINDKPSASSVSVMVSHYENLLKKIRILMPDAEVYVHGLLPVHAGKSKLNYSREISNDDIRAFNHRLEQLCRHYHATYIDLFTAYAVDGQLNPAWTTDGVHLNRDGYRQWKKFLEPYIPSE